MREQRYFNPHSPNREIALDLYESAASLPLIRPHGHVDPAILADSDFAFGSPVDLFISDRMKKMSVIDQLFSLEGQTAVVTGGTGVLGGAMAPGLARAGVKVGVLGRRADKAQAASEVVLSEGGTALPLPADVMNAASLMRARR
jgi:hypothetical protein